MLSDSAAFGPAGTVSQRQVVTASAPVATSPGHPHDPSRGSGRLKAIARGESFESAIHADVGAEEPMLEINGLNLWYGESQALYDINMTIPQGKVTAIIGPSGCGKSTLLRCINRMNDLVDGVRIEGDMRLHGESIYARGVDVIQLRKRMGMVFQKPNPFPMSIYENVVYPLRIDGQNNRGVLDDVCQQSLKGAAIWSELKDRLQENGLSLSGGQQQRLCIARAIAGDPDVLLLDEPCSALDPVATSKIEDLIKGLRGMYSIIIVTHNMQQASRISDFTAFMYLGRLVEYSPTLAMFTQPMLPETEDYITGRFG